MVSLVVLDLIGTTVDDGGAVPRALRTVVEETGAGVREEDLRTWAWAERGSAISALMALGGVQPGRGAGRQQLARFGTVLVDSWRTDPPREIAGAGRLFEQFQQHDIRVALTTDLDERTVAPLMESLGWWPARQHLIDTVVTADDVTTCSPAPYLIHRAMERTRVIDVHQVIAVGDTPVDLQAAGNAGATAVGVLTGAGDLPTLDAAPHDRLLASIADLPVLCWPEEPGAPRAMG